MKNDSEPPRDSRPAHVKAMDRVSEIIAISMCLVVPVLGGYYLDQWLGTGYLFTCLSLAFGLLAAVVLFRKLLVSLQRDSKIAHKK